MPGSVTTFAVQGIDSRRVEVEVDIRSGGLSLGGALRPVRGMLAMALAARREGIRRLIVPLERGEEAALVEGVEVIAVSDLERMGALLRGEWEPEPFAQGRPSTDPDEP